MTEEKEMTIYVPPEIKTYLDSCASKKRWGLSGKKQVGSYIFHLGLEQCDILFADMDEAYDKIMHSGNPYDEDATYFLQTLTFPFPFTCGKKVCWYATEEDIGRASEKAVVYGMTLDNVRTFIIIVSAAKDDKAHISIQRLAGKLLGKVERCPMTARRQNLSSALEYASKSTTA